MDNVDRSFIRVKAMVALLDPERRRHAVIRYGTEPTGAGPFHRLVGGSVEFGERAADAAVREVYEELGIRLTELEPLGVVENRFEYQGVMGHEVVFLYRCVISGDSIPPGGGWFADDDVPMWVEWRSLDAMEELQLYPDGAEELIHSE